MDMETLHQTASRETAGGLASIDERQGRKTRGLPRHANVQWATADCFPLDIPPARRSVTIHNWKVEMNPPGPLTGSRREVYREIPAIPVIQSFAAIMDARVFMSCVGSTGLDTWTWKPAPGAWARSSGCVDAVTAAAGIWPPRSGGRARTRRMKL